MIELCNFKFNYGQKNILNIKHLCLDTDKISILMGSNGSGKSTLLRILKFLKENLIISLILAISI